MAMLDRRPRVASAIAQTGCKLLVLPVEQFAACMLIIPDVKKRLRNLKELRTAQNRVDESRRVDRKRMAAGTSPRVR